MSDGVPEQDLRAEVVDPRLTPRVWNTRWALARVHAERCRMMITEFEGSAMVGYLATILRRQVVGPDGRLWQADEQIRVEEPYPLDFPSETWKQRVMILA